MNNNLFNNHNIFDTNFNNLKDFLYHNNLEKDKAIQEIKNNFSSIINNINIDDCFDFEDFYTLLVDEECFQKELEDNLLNILEIDTYKIDSHTLYKILKNINKDKILNNKNIQNKLTKHILQIDNPGYLQIIEDYIEEENHTYLFLQQLFMYIDRNVTEEKNRKTILNLIKCILKDPDYGSSTPTYLGSGCFKNCFKLNDYVLAVGKRPVIKNFDQSTAIIPPVFFNLIDEFQISLTPYLVKTDKEGIKQCWNQAKDDDIILLDINEENFGRFPKNFIHPFKNSTPLGKNFLGINNFNLEDRKKGDTCYLDIDYYINEKDNSPLSQNLRKKWKNNYKDLYDNYNQEKESAKIKKHLPKN